MQAGTVFIPEGSANSVVVVDVKTGASKGRIFELESIHGLSGAARAKYLVAGSYTEIERDGAVPKKPAGMSEDEHAALHAKPDARAMPEDMGLSLVSVLDAKHARLSAKAKCRALCIPLPFHQTAAGR